MTEPRYIEAEIVEESGPGQKAGGARVSARVMPDEGEAPKKDSFMAKVAMIVTFSVLLAAILILTKEQGTNRVSVNQAEAKPIMTQKKVITDAEVGRALEESKDPARYQNAQYDQLQRNMETVNRQLEDFNKQVNRRLALNEAEYKLYKKQILNEFGGELSDREVRDILLQAGFRPPQTITPEPVQIKQRSREETATFAKNIIGELVKDEVSSFLKKAQLLTEVSEHFARE